MMRKAKNVVAFPVRAIRNKADLKTFIRRHDDATAGELVTAINIALNEEVSANNEGHYLRLSAGRMLLDLRKLVTAEGNDWWKWQRGKFDRSRRDIERLIALADSPDPEGAAETEREKARIDMR